MMGLGLGGRFGHGGVYRDPRVLVPLVILMFIRFLVGGHTPEENVARAPLHIAERELGHLEPARAEAVVDVPEPGTYEIERINLDGSDVGWMPSPLVVAGVAGGGLAVMGAAGALMMLRREDDHEPEPVFASTGRVLVDEFYGDDEIRDLVARHERR